MIPLVKSKERIEREAKDAKIEEYALSAFASMLRNPNLSVSPNDAARAAAASGAELYKALEINRGNEQP